MRARKDPSRRELFGGGPAPERVHISSAVVFARPERANAVAAALARESNVEVHGRSGPRIIVVLEASTAGELGELLTRLTLMDGVISAAMVYEQLVVEEAVS
jgi:nitrate reductase NapD